MPDLFEIQLTVHMSERIVVGSDKQELSEEITNVCVPSPVGMRNLEFATVLFA
jgi:hypothetical protein